MKAPHARIVKFIRHHHVMTLATITAASSGVDAATANNNISAATAATSTSSCGHPRCANLFYSYMEAENVFVFTTDVETRHGVDMESDPRVGASIVLETRTVGLVRGLQIEGTAHRVDTCDESGEGFGLAYVAGDGRHSIGAAARRSYLRRFPYAALAPLTLWILRPTSMKFTDNRLGFGKKLPWPD